MPNLNSYGRNGAEFHVGQVVRIKATAIAARRHGEVGKIIEIRGDRLLIHMGHGAHFWLGREKILPS